MTDGYATGTALADKNTEDTNFLIPYIRDFSELVHIEIAPVLAVFEDDNDKNYAKMLW